MEKTETTTMGKRIAQLRKNKSFTQEQLAEKVGVSAQAVSKWENDISSPDISVIPLLAATLGVSTDELLGTKPIEPRVVVVESESRRKSENEFVIDLHRGKLDALIIGVLLIVFGVLYVLSRAGALPIFGNVSFFALLWPLAIVICGISWSIHSISPISLGVVALGAYFFAFNANWINEPLSWSIVWPIILILIGLSIVTGFLFKPWRIRWHKNVSAHYSDEDGFVNADVTFSGEKRKVACEEFRGGDIDVSFGSMTLDLLACKRFAEECVLQADVSFASLEILIPRHVMVIRSVDNSFAACNIHGSPDPVTTSKLYVKGDVSFGSIEVKYR